MKNLIVTFFAVIFGGISLEAQNEQTEKLYVVDTTESEIVWFCGNHYGCVSLDTGYIAVVGNKITEGEFVIDLRTVSDDDLTDNRLLRLTLNNVIKSLSFFDVETYPYSKFNLEEVLQKDSINYYVSGVLEIQDEVRIIDFDSKIVLSEERIIVESDIIDIDRTNWGVNYLSEKFDPEGKESMYVPDTISLLVHLFAYKKEIKK